MDAIKRLVQTYDLDLSRLEQLLSGSNMQVFVNYDEDIDTLMLMFVSLDVETVVHYLNKHIALLYHPETNEVIGIQVEAFRKYMEQNRKIKAAWLLDEPIRNRKVHDLGQLVNVYNKRTPSFARELAQATEEVIRPNGPVMVFAADD
jgi:hypothetical protein